jgi:hypothetical protein
MKFCGQLSPYFPDASYAKKRLLDDIMEHAARAYPRDHAHAQIIRRTGSPRDATLASGY